MYTLPEALTPLAAYGQFVLTRVAPKPGGHSYKTNKFACWPHDQPTTAISAKTKEVYVVNKGDSFDPHNPTCWLTYEQARALAVVMPISGDTIQWTIGFVLTPNDPFGVLDLDDCLTLQNTWNDNALKMMVRLPGANEVSLSGRGLHDWFYYTGTPPSHGKRNQASNMELYTEKRFIALGTTATGQMYDLTALLPAFVAEYFPQMAEIDSSGEDWADAPVPEYTPLEDDELLRRAMARTRQQDPSNVFGAGVFLPSFADLWNRDVEALAAAFPGSDGKPFGESDADFALAKELGYWTGKNHTRIEALMRQSALVRDKWDEGRAGYGTWLQMTIRNAVAVTTQVYHVKPIVLAPVVPCVDATGRLTPRLIEGPAYVHREALVQMFDSCVYIQDNNAILLPNGDIVDQARFNAKFAGHAFAMDKNGEKSTKSAWEGFLSNQVVHFPRVEGTEFNPRLDYQQVVERGGRNWVNVYKKPVVDRRPGDVAPFMELLHKLFPGGDDALILLSYMAAVVQNPGVKFRWAPFIQGTRGNGKSTIVECLKHALGHKYVFTLKAGMIENGFNSWLENNVLYIADDIYCSKDRTDMMEALKSLITGRDQAITLKGIDSILKKICGNFIFMDNHKDAMKKQEDTRDLCVLYCAQQSKQDRVRDGLTNNYFVKTFIPWLEAGGYAFVAEMLHTMEIDARYNPAGECQEAPDTSTTAAAVSDSRTGYEADMQELIDLDEPGFAGGFVSQAAIKRHFEGDRRLTPTKIAEVLNRLGYQRFGRLPHYVMFDDTKPIVFVRADSYPAEVADGDILTALYVAAQSAAQTAQTTRKFGGVQP